VWLLFIEEIPTPGALFLLYVLFERRIPALGATEAQEIAKSYWVQESSSANPALRVHLLITFFVITTRTLWICVHRTPPIMLIAERLINQFYFVSKMFP